MGTPLNYNANDLYVNHIFYGNNSTQSLNPPTVATQRYQLTGVNFNSANNDNALLLALPTQESRFFVDSIWICNASHDISTATVGAFTGAGGTGATLAADQAITVTATANNTNNNAQKLTLTNSTTECFFGTTVYVRTGTAQGIAAIADVIVYIRLLS